MNIIKIKDIIINPTDSGLTQDQCDLFNTKFRGKYVYCIDWCYIALLEDMTESDVITASRKLVKESDIQEESWMSYDEIKNYTMKNMLEGNSSHILVSSIKDSFYNNYICI